MSPSCQSTITSDEIEAREGKGQLSNAPRIQSEIKQLQLERRWLDV